MKFTEELQQQRWDDHRFYHHNRVNQLLHLLSASCFVASYYLIFVDPVMAVMVGWLLAMVLRQIGHFVFEPKSYDEVNQVSHEYKESVKVGYNLRRKVILLSIWVAIPVLLWLNPSLFGLLGEQQVDKGLLHTTAILWLATGIGAVLFRTVHLFFLMGIQSGLVWATKILTDPFHDIKIYHRAPLHILKGNMYDDMSQWYTQIPDAGRQAQEEVHRADQVLQPGSLMLPTAARPGASQYEKHGSSIDLNHITQAVESLLWAAVFTSLAIAAVVWVAILFFLDRATYCSGWFLVH